MAMTRPVFKAAHTNALSQQHGALEALSLPGAHPAAVDTAVVSVPRRTWACRLCSSRSLCGGRCVQSEVQRSLRVGSVGPPPPSLSVAV